MWKRGKGQLWRALPILCTGLLFLMPVHPRVPVAHTALAPADLAIRFEALLGQHSVLAADLMRSRIRGDDDFVQAANTALGRNTKDMTDLVGQLFGTGTAEKFSPLWSEHIVELFAYAGALAARDDTAKGDALHELTEYEVELGDFFAGASQGRLRPAAARQAVVAHVGHLTGQADAYAAGDYATADDLYRMGYQHTYDLGLTLAEALLPAADAATLREPLWRLRSQLGRLLAEHAVLVEDLTRAAVTETPDFAASGNMINGNTRDLAAAMDTLFGPAAARQFQALWADHVEQLVAYAQGHQDTASTAMAGIERRLGAFLSGATGERIGTAALTAALQKHDMMLMRHADAYAAKDYATAHDVAYQTYQEMFDLARTMADAFGASVAAKLPRGGAQTGHGGMAAIVSSLPGSSSSGPGR
ncbi:hypothetical protein [Paractinoplanes toevensis]|uniref:Copper amine oxidase n=1 Tax=Paractinoplanes toevensis TaxID=571911 RepID=A0A919W3F4_9ACTN|nr:hypothetical protein [Actinoplanes toevensis]GIM89043.1 hypothetical protein Ato02nite_008360 [Actinoplanes toevensis]